MKKSEIVFGALRVPVDYLAALGAFLLAYFIRPVTDLIPGVQFHFGLELLPPFQDYALFAVFASLFLVFLFAFNGLYSLRVTGRFTRESLKIGFLVSVWLMFIIAWYFLIVHELFFSRIALAHIWLFTIALVIAGRLIIRLIQRIALKFGVGRRKVLLIGADTVTDRFFEAIKTDPTYEIIGTLADHVFSRKKGQVKVVGAYAELESVIQKYGVEEVIQTTPELANVDASDIHAFCRGNQIKFHFVPDLIRLQRANVEVEMIDGIPVISLKETPLDGWGHVYKRVFDLSVSLFLIILLIPLWIILPILIRLDSKGAAFYRSRRKYRDKVFSILKFRTMVMDADRLKKNLGHLNERSGPFFKIKNDPRVTKMGRFLRKTSIDELPQLFNVLTGSMSLVGPRPHLPEEIDRYERSHKRVFALKPGITGLAQVSGRSSLDFDEEIKLDVYYIENWSVWLDIRLILKSIGVMFRADGE
jgi:exopolysaccharide biosynthesis polyprenyl glycosylphosphotransferase